MCLLRINLSNLYPNMNHFDEVDFSECRPEEVISSFDAQYSSEFEYVPYKNCKWGLHTKL